jgi:hypothetical protein
MVVQMTTFVMLMLAGRCMLATGSWQDVASGTCCTLWVTSVMFSC